MRGSESLEGRMLVERELDLTTEVGRGWIMRAHVPLRVKTSS